MEIGKVVGSKKDAGRFLKIGLFKSLRGYNPGMNSSVET